MDRIDKDWTELDFSAVDLASGEWGSGRGGYPLRDDEYSISYYNDDGVETRYKLPSCISQMLALQFTHGGDAVKRELSSLLRIEA